MKFHLQKSDEEIKNDEKNTHAEKEVKGVSLEEKDRSPIAKDLKRDSDESIIALDLKGVSDKCRVGVERAGNFLTPLLNHQVFPGIINKDKCIKGYSPNSSKNKFQVHD